MYKWLLSPLLIIAMMITSLSALSPIALAGDGDNPPADPGWVYKGQATNTEKQAAAERFKELYFSVQSQNDSTSSTQATGFPVAAPDFVIGAPGTPYAGIPVPHFFGPYPNYAQSPLPTITYAADNVTITNVTGGIRKFVDSLPGLGPANANDLGQYLQVAVPDTTTYSGSDYYVIALVEVEEQLHSDLPPTTLRQYVQLATDVVPGDNVALTGPGGTPILMPDGSQAMGVDYSHYLGPVIVVDKDTPVRIKFYNLLPTGEAGNLFIPVDTTYMGAGPGPVEGANQSMIDYTQNRATVHLHGGHTPWISDGTPHQWITPANESTPYPQGVSVYPVPDMNDNGDPTDGSMTFYYTNQQSARLMFYHDHAFGITRLNVLVGEAAGYIITDPVEKDLVNGTNDTGVNPQNLNILPAADKTIPLIIQDKTFVADNVTPYTNIFGTYASQMAFYDPTWDYNRWGDFGDLWYPHVYMTVQNPDDPGGLNAFGRWHYGPWFWPPTTTVNGPVANPYYDPINAPWEPRYIPGTPPDSGGMETYFDTPLVNGTAYPYLDVDPATYRFRILNASNDRFFNLQLELADNTTTTWNGTANTEVKMIPAAGTLPDGWVADGRAGGLPDPTMVGPDMIQIANEGGFLPEPVVLTNTPISWIMDPSLFAFGNVDRANLQLGPAERADIVVDFSAFAGKTIILYNDAPAPYPAIAPQYDYYTGSPDLTASGGAPGTIPGYGPNTRTIMQFRVSNAQAAAPYDLNALQEVFTPSNGDPGVFAIGQDPIFVGQAAYNNVYGSNFSSSAPLWGAVNIADSTISFETLNGTTVNNFMMEKKAVQDEMGEAFDPEYGRMSGMLGLELPASNAGNQNFMLYPFLAPPVDLIPIGDTYDGFQVWRITHNGVDTHPIHFHLYEVQLLNRVAWDGQLFWPDPNELGWKETIRVSPLEDTIVAIRPKIPDLPFDIPNSIRLIDPTKQEGEALRAPNGGFQDPLANPVTVTNHFVNFGWEYVFHCHILSHEEMDMMHIFSVAVPPVAPTNLTGNLTGVVANLEWTDASASETNWTIQRGESATGPWQTVGMIDSSTGPVTGGNITYSEVINASGHFYYQIKATNIVGDTFDYGAQAVGFPNYTLNSEATNVLDVGVVVPSSINVTLSGMTTGGPNQLQLNGAGVVQATTQISGPRFSINIPAGTTILNSQGIPVSTLTYSAPTTINAQPNTQIGLIGLNFGPSGTVFTSGGTPVTLTVSYNPNQLPAGVTAGSLILAVWDGTAWVPLANIVDNGNGTVTGTLAHFSTFALSAPARSVALGTGWNILSTPVKLNTATNTWSKLASASGLNFSAAYVWDGTAFVWFDPAKELKPLDAVYVNMNAPGTVAFVPSTSLSSPAAKPLVPGWNLVGSAFFTTNNTQAVDSTLLSAYSAPGNTMGYTQIISPSGVNQNAWIYSRDTVVDNQMMEMGRGYWVYMQNAGTLAGFTQTP